MKPNKPEDPNIRRYSNRDGSSERVNWKSKIAFSTRRSFTWRERLLILLGYDMDIYTKIFSIHMPGKFATDMSAVVSPLKDVNEIKKQHEAWRKLQQVSLAPSEMPPVVPN